VIPVLGLTFGELLLTIFYIWLLMLFLGMLFSVFGDIFRRDISGWSKAFWSIFILVLPFIGILVYVLSRGQDWNKDHAAWASKDRNAMRASLGVGTAEELTQLAALRDQGQITPEEYESAKSKLL
jgi:cbb3-type cytochrome oxidase subunit 3